ncbi:F-box/LRR-repeat protein 3 isoform X5 [Cryptomeria japonica]|uniref:F-box/LRR-repeat protein 3 isoform X4 n=1 Tax=Cryptomeria japonica TaxID=3369 RepID=UPI0027D9D531|nr:F-box/LRR-repeat protein 3 isoform X4 [Cryptomeria japonica]XP_057846354.2 F-box/LRR-repeat protein 3 isoform X5 [Cryptomeria japonica]
MQEELVVSCLFLTEQDGFSFLFLPMQGSESMNKMASILSLLGDDILLRILRSVRSPTDRKSWSLVCKHFYHLEALCKERLQLLRRKMLTRILERYGNLLHLDFSLCPQITDECLEQVARLSGQHLRSINLSKLSCFSHIGLFMLAKGCENLVEIDLSSCSRIGDKEADAISQAKNLQSLKLVKCQQISDLGLVCIAVRCGKLRYLNLKWCVGISDSGIEMVAVKCKELRFLDLSYLQITNKSIASVAQLEYLETLVLVGCVSVDDEGLDFLKDGCKSLQRLDVSKCQNVSCNGIISVTSGSIPLQQLTLAYCVPQVTSAIFASLQKFESLQSIKFDGCEVSSSGLESIGKSCKYLQELSLSKCSGATDEGISLLVAGCRDLRIVDLTCCHNLTDVAVSAIGMSCTNLSCLKMESCSLVTETSLNVLGDNCHFLEVLDLTDSSINNTGLKFISRCSKLTTLKLGICESISDEGLTYIGAHCSDLLELDLYRSAGVGDVGLAAIACACPKLKICNLSYCIAITDESLKSLSQLEGLHNLEIRGCIHVTSAGLSAIAMGCRHLVELDIKRCCCVDDVGLVTLVHCCQNLRQINISYCPISDVGMLALANLSCLQNIKLVHLRNVSLDTFAFGLLACKSLKKIKVLKHLKSLLPPGIFEHLEEQGCRIRWMDKPL